MFHYLYDKFIPNISENGGYYSSRVRNRSYRCLVHTG